VHFYKPFAQNGVHVLLHVVVGPGSDGVLLATLVEQNHSILRRTATNFVTMAGYMMMAPKDVSVHTARMIDAAKVFLSCQVHSECSNICKYTVYIFHVYKNNTSMYLFDIFLKALC